MNTLKKQVEKVLQSFPDTRNSDITLTIKVWQTFYGVGNNISIGSLYNLPREDNIKRIRAKFCEEGKSWAYPTSLEVARKRKIKEDEWKQALGYHIGQEKTNKLFFI